MAAMRDRAEQGNPSPAPVACSPAGPRGGSFLAGGQSQRDPRTQVLTQAGAGYNAGGRIVRCALCVLNSGRECGGTPLNQRDAGCYSPLMRVPCATCVNNTSTPASLPRMRICVPCMHTPLPMISTKTAGSHTHCCVLMTSTNRHTCDNSHPARTCKCRCDNSHPVRTMSATLSTHVQRGASFVTKAALTSKKT